jgi:hypothetical protein
MGSSTRLDRSALEKAAASGETLRAAVARPGKPIEPIGKVTVVEVRENDVVVVTAGNETRVVPLDQLRDLSALQRALRFDHRFLRWLDFLGLSR